MTIFIAFEKSSIFTRKFRKSRKSKSIFVVKAGDVVELRFVFFYRMSFNPETG